MKRYISTSFWDDEWIMSLDFTEKGLYLYLLTNPLTNIAGIYKLPKKRMIFDTGLKEDQIEEIMQKFQDDGKAYRHGDFVILPSWPRHQKVQNANIQKGINNILISLEPELLQYLCEIGYKYPLEDFLQQPIGAGMSGFSQPEISEKESSLSDEQKLYFELWKTAKDKNGMLIFPITSPLENPREWNKYWKESPPTAEQIRTMFKNYIDGVNSGAIKRQYIASYPDRLLLRGGLAKYQEPVQKDKSDDKKSEKNWSENRLRLGD